MVKAIYHTLSIWSINDEPITSKTVFNHAVSIGKKADKSILFTHTDPPSEIKSKFDTTKIISGSTPFTRIINSVRSANNLIDGDDWRYISTYHYEPSLSAYLCCADWILDANENPRKMTISHNSSKLNYIINPIFRRIANKAKVSVQTSHPASPDRYGEETRYVSNGAVTKNMPELPVEKFNNKKMVWSGAKKGTEIALEALSMMDDPITIDIYGDVPDHMKDVQDLGIDNYVNFKGRVPHKKILSELPHYTMGLCTLPRRQDFVYAHPLKIGEYLANGVIPIMSDFPGMRAMARGTGIYTDPEPEQVASSIETIMELNKDDLRERAHECQSRAIEISWEKERDWFAEQALN